MKQWWYIKFDKEHILAKYFLKIYETSDAVDLLMIINFHNLCEKYTLNEWVNDEGMSVAQIHNLTEIIH